MMWQTMEERLALLELLARGRLKLRRAQSSAYATLAELPWTRATGRRDEIGLIEERRTELVALLDRAWPDWGAALTALTAHGLPLTPEGFGRLEDARRAATLPMLPGQLNRRTAAALTAPHSKAVLTERRLAALGDTATTRDGTVRLRPPHGMVVRSSRGSVDLAAVAAVLGEIAVSERAFRQGLAIEGMIRAVLFVENLGAWRDLPALDEWLFAHVPGWDTPTVLQLLEHLAPVPVVHFGDLDPNGVRIFVHLRERCPGLRWFVPPFWRELIESHGQPGAWPADLDLHGVPELVCDLVERQLWLEQEPLVVDRRIGAALQAML